MIWLSIAILFIPLIAYVTYILYVNIRILYGYYVAEENDHIDHANYETIPLSPIRVNIKFESGEWGLAFFDVTRIHLAQDQRMYSGSQIGSIPIPFGKVGFSSRKFYQRKNYITYKESFVTLTNSRIRIYAYNSPVFKQVLIHDIAWMRITEYGSTVYIKTEDNLPFQIRFRNTEEAVFFMNAVWTVKFNGFKYYSFTKKQQSEQTVVKPKAITKWDIKRNKKDIEKFPELETKTWREIIYDRQKAKADEKLNDHKDFAEEEDLNSNEAYDIKEGKKFFFFKKKKNIKDAYTLENGILIDSAEDGFVSPLKGSEDEDPISDINRDIPRWMKLPYSSLKNECLKRHIKVTSKMKKVDLSTLLYNYENGIKVELTSLDDIKDDSGDSDKSINDWKSFSLKKLTQECNKRRIKVPSKHNKTDLSTLLFNYENGIKVETLEEEVVE